MQNCWDELRKETEQNRNKQHEVRLYLYDQAPGVVVPLIDQECQTRHSLVRAGTIFWNATTPCCVGDNNGSKHVTTDKVYEYIWFVKDSEDSINFASEVNVALLKLGFTGANAQKECATYLSEFGRGKYHIVGLVNDCTWHI